MGVRVGHRCLVVAVVLVAGAVGVSTTSAVAEARTVSASELSQRGWVWPAERFALSRPFIQPAHEYGPGHRGIDLDLLSGTVVRSPADGTVAFVGDVAGRSVVTIAHEGELVSTLEPAMSELSVGTVVSGGEAVGMLGTGGHVFPGALHFGVRLRGAYINPLVLLGGIPRAILLPCCE